MVSKCDMCGMRAGVDVVTLGQYMRPDQAPHGGGRVRHAGGVRRLEAAAKDLGFLYVAAGPAGALAPTARASTS